jgi:predicted ATPase/DNA-binding XRE family transcriptional regulator
MSFSELLRRHRIASGVSQEALAERARISASAIGALERGARRAPYRETVTLLADALGLSAVERGALEDAAERGRGRSGGAGPESRHNLQARLTSFVGRDDEIAAIKALLARHRLVTVTGSGGIGKTRAAMEAAQQRLDEEQDEVWFVDLSPVTDGAFVAGAIASVLEVPLAQVADPLPSLAAVLKTRKLLLILDNCEHVVQDAAAAATSILRTCPGIVILATSRERLAIDGESVYRLPSLMVPAESPTTIEEACEYAALRLFIERATAVDAHLTLNAERLGTVVDICRRLEGIPLAIELAASRLPALGLVALNNRIRDHFELTSGARDLPHRQRTMLATIAWSYDLLSENEQTLLRRLSVFSGGATLEAAEKVCTDDMIGAGDVAELLSLLVDKSLLNIAFFDELGRYVMLESVRTFASRKLADTGEFTRVARAHAAWIASLADRADSTYPRVPRNSWLREFEPELDNARSALDWTLNTRTDPDALLAARIVGGLRGLWMSTERRVECRRWAQAALDRVDAEQAPLVTARVMRAHIQSIDGSAVLDAASRAIPLFESIGDRRGLISLQAHVAWEHGLRGAFTSADDSIARAFQLAGEEGLRHSRQYGRLLHARCLIRALAGRLEEARSDAAAAARLRNDLGEVDPILDLYWEAFFAFSDGEAERSAELLEAGIEHARASSKNPAGQMSELAAVRIVLGELGEAKSAARDALELARFEQLDSVWRAIQHLAAIAALDGHPIRAARLLGFVDAWREEKGGFRGYYERASYDILMGSLREQLAAEKIAGLAAEGMLLDFERAVDEALS